MTQTKIHPVPGFLLVQPQKQEQTTASGILLPDNHQDKPQQGKVLAVGGNIFDDGREISAPCQVGDVVVYREWGGKEIKQDNIDLLLLKFDDIMAIVK
ncbi:MAG: co-chaperone GroES [Candidatus Shapirobacteria bacterium]|nr:co-chaperone GroES [Candidatus Shapirobacteria bacterium]